jgi:hypothetical protein
VSRESPTAHLLVSDASPQNHDTWGKIERKRSDKPRMERDLGQMELGTLIASGDVAPRPAADRERRLRKALGVSAEMTGIFGGTNRSIAR